MMRRREKRKFLSSRRSPEVAANRKNKDPPSILILDLRWSQTRSVSRSVQVCPGLMPSVM